jgi:hypothetical protein
MINKKQNWECLIQKNISEQEEKKILKLFAEYHPCESMRNNFQREAYRSQKWNCQKQERNFFRTREFFSEMGFVIFRDDQEIIAAARFALQRRNYWSQTASINIIQIIVKKGFCEFDVTAQIMNQLFKNDWGMPIGHLFWTIKQSQFSFLPFHHYREDVIDSLYKKNLSHTISNKEQNAWGLRKANENEKRTFAQEALNELKKKYKALPWIKLTSFKLETITEHLNNWRDYSWNREFLILEKNGERKGVLSFIHVSTGLAPKFELAKVDVFHLDASRPLGVKDRSHLQMAIENYLRKKEYKNVLFPFGYKKQLPGYEWEEITFLINRFK